MTDEILHELKLFDNSRLLTNQLFSIMRKLPLASLFSFLPTHKGIVIYDWTICTACYSVIEALLIYSQSHSHQDLRNLIYSMCINLETHSDEICAGVIDLNTVIEIHLEHLYYHF